MSQEKGLAEISDTDFALLTALIHERTGLFLPPGKKPLLAARLSERMRALGLASYAEYHRYVTLNADGELSRMTDVVCTHETRFFRDVEQLDYIEKVLIPGFIVRAAHAGQPRRIRAWSAGCSTGEEAFTLAMILLAKLPADRFSIEVLGTDISAAAIERARAAKWPAQRVQEIPEPYRTRFFLLDRRTGDYEPSIDLRSVVRFQRLNLLDVFYKAMGRYDLIFCRNVLIYFDAETRAAVVRRLLERLAPRGLLFLGMTESLLALRDGSMGPSAAESGPMGPVPLRSVGPAIYARRKGKQPAGTSRDGVESIRPPRSGAPPPPTEAQRKFWSDPLTAWKAQLTWALGPRQPR
jgi:chemotaxis protein methyltransferase CheR